LYAIDHIVAEWKRMRPRYIVNSQLKSFTPVGILREPEADSGQAIEEHAADDHVVEVRDQEKAVVQHDVRARDGQQHPVMPPIAKVTMKPMVRNSGRGIHLWHTLPSPWTAQEMARAALAQGLSVTPSEAFVSGASAPNAVRLSLGAVRDRARLEDALLRFKKLLESPPHLNAAL
jgi:hypothetical protein